MQNRETRRKRARWRGEIFSPAHPLGHQVVVLPPGRRLQTSSAQPSASIASPLAHSSRGVLERSGQHNDETSQLAQVPLSSEECCGFFLRVCSLTMGSAPGCPANSINRSPKKDRLTRTSRKNIPKKPFVGWTPWPCCMETHGPALRLWTLHSLGASFGRLEVESLGLRAGRLQLVGVGLLQCQEPVLS